MNHLLIVDNPDRWPLHVPGVEIVSARSYLTDPHFASLDRVRVYNLCRSFKYQTAGYYVSLLATARGHQPLPSIETIQDLRLDPVIRVASQELDELIQTSLKPLKSETFELSIYFGKNIAARYDRLASALFSQFPAPLLRVTFEHNKRWSIQNIRVLGSRDIPDSHRDFCVQQAENYFYRPARAKRRKPYRYDLAILRDPDEALPPSSEKTIGLFCSTAESHGLRTELIGKMDYGRVAEFDALFIRETTAVNHHTFRFARRASASGVIVIDDPQSILRCTNKVFLAEMLTRHNLPTPKTVIFSKDNWEQVVDKIGYPFILKQPDSSFSAGVLKIEDQASLDVELPRMLEASELLIAQEFVPTEFDWRIGVLDGQPLYACRYHMARRHWQIIKHESGGRVRYGGVDTLPVHQAPPKIVRAAVKAAKLIGDGLYGIDCKEVGGIPMIIEVNDNPNIDAGVEDRVLGPLLYETIIRTFISRIESRKR
ncbi:MAG: RimK family protein [Phycisphaeraceae bacterium]